MASFEHLRVDKRSPKLAKHDAAATLDLDRECVEASADEQRASMRDLQARLAAEARTSVLLVLQGLDASGKDGVVRRVFSGVNPMGCRVTSFKVPSDLELSYHYLWRITAVLPRRGEIGIFNRSHYEDVVTTRVLDIIDDDTQLRRVAEIRAFENALVANGTAVVKVFLHVSKDEQRRRLQARVDDPTKRWKFKPADLITRALWDDYHEQHDRVLRATSTSAAPWYVVPADRKWVRDHVVTALAIDALRSLDPKYPPADGWDPASIAIE